MWSGRIVPLVPPLGVLSSVHRPLAADAQSPSGSERGLRGERPLAPEQLLLPLPEDLCFGTGIRNGASVHIGYQINPPLSSAFSRDRSKSAPTKTVRSLMNDWLGRFGHDVAAWIVVSPFPLEDLPERVMQLIVSLNNRAGALHEAVAQSARGLASTMQVEGMATGDFGCVLVFDEPIDEKMKDFLEKLKRQMGPKKALRRFECRVGAKRPRLNVKQRKNIEFEIKNQIGWLEILADPNQVSRGGQLSESEAHKFHSRKITIRDRMVMIPWGEITRGYQVAREWLFHNQKHLASAEDRDEWLDLQQELPQYALLVREPDLPIVVALVPQRLLVQLELPLRSNGFISTAISSGPLDAMTGFLSRRKINIWHVQQLPMQVSISPLAENRKEYSYFESRLRVVGVAPREWQYEQPSDVKKELERLRVSVARLRAPAREKVDSLVQCPKELWKAFQYVRRGLRALDIKWGNGKVISVGGVSDRWAEVLEFMENNEREDVKKLRAFLENAINGAGRPLAARESEVEVHAPPLLRMFFSHSAQPADDEEDHIRAVKAALEKYAIQVEEGQFRAGLSTEELSRGRIRLCSVLVSLFWPRADCKDKEGRFQPAPWVSHEESFALGLGLRMVRIIEDTVERPRYEYDRPAITFRLGDAESWKKAMKELNDDLKDLVLSEAKGTRLLT